MANACSPHAVLGEGSPRTPVKTASPCSSLDRAQGKVSRDCFQKRPVLRTFSTLPYDVDLSPGRNTGPAIETH
jgi:hypothetical protein